jgi:DHA3 family macrolide efflux protein-like MFS transporter
MKKKLSTFIKNNPSFSLLWGSQALSRFGDAMETIAIVYLVLKLTGSALAMGTVMLFSLLPNLILTPFAGVLADCYPRKRMMIISEVARGILILWIPVAFWLKILTIEQLYVVAFLVSVFETFFETANTASMPSLFTDPDDLSWGYSLKGSTQSMVQLLGVLVFGVILTWIDFSGIFLFDAITFLLSALAVTFMKIPHTIKAEATRKVKVFFTSMAEGFKYIKTKTVFIIITIVAAVINFIIAPLQVIVLYLLNNVYHLDESYMGPILAIILVGMALGNILYQLIHKYFTSRNLVTLGIVGVGCGFGIGGFVHNVYLFSIGLFILTVSSGVAQVKVSMLFVESIENEFRGRAASFLNFFLLIGGPLSAASVGFLINYFGIHNLLKCGAYTIIGTALLMFILWPKNQLSKSEPTPAPAPNQVES